MEATGIAAVGEAGWFLIKHSQRNQQRCLRVSAVNNCSEEHVIPHRPIGFL